MLELIETGSVCSHGRVPCVESSVTTCFTKNLF
jgi:hypothetical protein